MAALRGFRGTWLQRVLLAFFFSRPPGKLLGLASEDETRASRGCMWQKSHSQLLLHRPLLCFSNMQGRQGCMPPEFKCRTEPNERGADGDLA
eukprot:CAMPEP_0170608674 /NCGR_PEP_ID=MMETSP0224-20130122/21711_1 /TAXON_ID=285029 /ORGANISM="Togula jolla, Strain CCCM 725" /LENGTH=91 /DNA_ID=CAMNT_0010933917 /DNA_START=532 /DNA_END=807 /DNA_ORIENTATION=+